MAAFLELGERVLNKMPDITDAVVYGSLAISAAFVFAITYFGIVWSYPRTTSPLVPPSKAVAAAQLLLAPLAAVLLGLGYLAEQNDLPVFSTYSPALVLACLCGTPLLLWCPAVALTAYPPFRDSALPEAAPPAAGTGQLTPRESSSGREGLFDVAAAAAEQLSKGGSMQEPADGGPAAASAAAVGSGDKKED